MNARDEWARALATWAIPEEILAAAPESPWALSVDHFVQRADLAVLAPAVSHRRALEALPVGGVVLDVGCGAGAGSLPLAKRAGRLIGVDASPAMLRAFAERAQALGTAVTTLAGSWPEMAAATPPADVVVCHHVLYNVPDPVPFVRALDDHARRRVVLEISAEHPLHQLGYLWLRFHGLQRPDRPTADDAIAVLREAGLRPEWQEGEARPGLSFQRREDLVAWVRKRLCLAAERDAEIDAAIAGKVVLQDNGHVSLPNRKAVTIWWDHRDA